MTEQKEEKGTARALIDALVNSSREPEIAVFKATVRIEYPLDLETEEEAREWLADLLEHEGEEITMSVEDLERDSDV